MRHRKHAFPLPRPPCLNHLLLFTPENVGFMVLTLALANTCCLQQSMPPPHFVTRRTVLSTGTSTADVAGAMPTTNRHEASVAPAATKVRCTLQRRTRATNNPHRCRVRRWSGHLVPGRAITMVVLVRRCRAFLCARPAEVCPRRGGLGRRKSWKRFWRACSRLWWEAGTARLLRYVEGGLMFSSKHCSEKCCHSSSWLTGSYTRRSLCCSLFCLTTNFCLTTKSSDFTRVGDE